MVLLLFSLLTATATGDDDPTTTRAHALGKEALAQSGRLEAAAPLIRLWAMNNDVDDLNLLAEPYAILLSRRGVNPEVQRLARIFYAEVEQSRGRTTKAADVLEPLSFVQD